MYKQQFEQIADKPDVDDFMSTFGFDYPTATADLSFTETEWWQFGGLNRRDPLHRKKVVKASYEVFANAKAGLSATFYDWLSKYLYLYNYWTVKLEAETEIPVLEEGLTKPLKEYVYDRYNKCYKHKGAQALSAALAQLKYANEAIECRLKTSDEPPVVHDDVTRNWYNFKLTCEITANNMALDAKKPKREKKVIDEPIELKVNDVKVRGDYTLEFLPKTVLKALRQLPNDHYVIFFGAVVNVGKVQSWLSEFTDSIVYELLDNGFRLTWRKPGSGVMKTVANFLDQGKEAEKTHTLTHVVYF